MYQTPFSNPYPHGNQVYSILVIRQLHELQVQNAATQSYRYAKGSASNVISGIRQFLYFTAYFQLSPLPASELTIVLFLEFMARSSRFGHLKHLLSCVKYLHESLNYTIKCDTFQIDATMQGLKRRLACVPFRVLPITPEILRSMYIHLDMSSKHDLALWCAFLISFYGLLRKKNAVPETSTQPNSSALLRRHISVDTNSNMVYVYVGHSKTNNFCTRDIVLPIPGNSDPALYPVRHLLSLLNLVNTSQDSPAFSFSNRGFITHSAFTQRLKQLLRKIGLNPDLFSGHSFRRGGATFLHNCGGTALMIQACGDWSSMCFIRYLYLTEAQRMAAQDLIRASLNQSL